LRTQPGYTKLSQSKARVLWVRWRAWSEEDEWVGGYFKVSWLGEQRETVRWRRYIVIISGRYIVPFDRD
jgi:hypothetical protein